MSRLSMNRELALSIGLAARALPNIAPKQLINLLIDLLGHPITEEKIHTLTYSYYQQAIKTNFNQSYSDVEIQDSLVCLKFVDHSQTIEKVKVCAAKLKTGQTLPCSIRVAITSKDGLWIDDQFSNCYKIYIFQVSAVGHQLIEIRDTTTEETIKGDEKRVYRAKLIKDCQVLYSLSIGGPVAAKIIKLGIHPVKVHNVVSIDSILDQLQHVLASSPPPWLAKSMGLKPTSSNLYVNGNKS